MMNTEAMPMAEHTDSDLVAESLNGSRDAFRRIVERYQTMICSLAYSATGNLSHSEDLAQETFITAWANLRSLREPDKLRAWLCGIVRNCVLKKLRRDGREPAHAAAPLEEALDSPAREALLSEQAINREEEAILWRSLESIPELYREPLVLFYREHQSIDRVAATLELSEDAVKQRLSRGRKLLQEEVQAFVENTLQRTAPGQAFSGAVLAALPLAAPIATAGAAAGAKGAAAAKSSLLLAWLAPFAGIFAGFVAQWLMINAGSTGRARWMERIKLVMAWVFVLTFSIGGQQLVRIGRQHYGWSDRIFFEAMAGFWWFYAMVIATWITIILRRTQTKRRSTTTANNEMAYQATRMRPGLLIAIAVIGTHLMLFSSVLCIAWQAQDRIVAGVIAIIMLASCLWHFFAFYRKAAAGAGGEGYIQQLAMICAAVLAIFNLRFDVWLARGYGSSVAEVHQMFPIWMVPVLTAALALWTALLVVWTRPKSVPN